LNLDRILVTRQVLQSLMARIVAMVASLSVMVVAARLLGPEGKGQYAYFMAVLGLGMQCGALGISTANAYYSSRQPTIAGRLAANTIVIALAASLLMLLAVGALSIVFSNLLPYGVLTTLLVACASFLGLIWMGGQTLLVGAGLVGWFNGLTVLYSVLLGAVMASVFQSGSADANIFALSQIACYGFVVVVLLAGLRLTTGQRLRVDLELLRPCLQYGLAVYLAQAIGFAVTRIDLFVVKHYLPAASLGAYSLAGDFCNALIQLQAAANVLLFSHLVRTHESPSRLKLTFRFLRNSAVIYLLALGGAAFWLEDAVLWIFGPQFSSAVRAILALMPGTAFLALASILQNHLVAGGWPGKMGIPPLIGCVVSLSLNVILVPRQGIVGAAIASSVGYAAMMATSAVLVLLLERRAMAENS
jgi:O-antigen/teichoic acid export membrane protein